MNILIVKDDGNFSQRLFDGLKKYSDDYMVDMVDIFESDVNYDVVLVDIAYKTDAIDSPKSIYLSYFTDKRQRMINKYQTLTNFLSDMIDISMFQNDSDMPYQFHSNYYYHIDAIDKFAMKQIRKNNINDLVQMKIENDCCYYNTHALVPILQYYQYEKITELQIVKHLKQILSLSDLLADYLLFPDHVLLEVENIFMDKVSQQLKFVYLPTNKACEQRYQLEEIIAYFLYECDIDCDTQQLYPLFKYTKSIRSIKQFKMTLDSVEAKLSHPFDDLVDRKEKVNSDNASINSTIIMREQLSDVMQSPEVVTVVDVNPIIQNAEKSMRHMNKKWWFNWKNKPKEEPVIQQPKVEVEVYEGMAETTLLLSREVPKIISAKMIHIKTNDYFVVESLSDFTIGSTQDNTCYIQHNAAVSRRHAVIKYLNQQFVLVDYNSTNGTGVNGQLLSKGGNQMLQNGDMITIADESFQFLMD